MSAETTAIGLILLLSGFTMSFAGFGFALVSVPLLALFLSVKVAVILQFPYCMGLFMYQAWHYRKHFSWTPMQPLFLGTILGLTAGTLLLYHLPESLLKRILAFFIMLFVLFNFFSSNRRFAKHRVHSPWLGRICGFVSGSFLGAYTIGGPPIVMYFSLITKDPLEAKSFMATFFSILFIVLAVVYGAAGMFTPENLKTTVVFSPVVILGSVAGFWAFRHASSRMYYWAVNLLLLLASVTLWIRS
jgi:uncharacterized membrane protein YfcA